MENTWKGTRRQITLLMNKMSPEWQKFSALDPYFLCHLSLTRASCVFFPPFETIQYITKNNDIIKITPNGLFS